MPLAFPPAPTAYFVRAKETRSETRESENNSGFKYFSLGHLDTKKNCGAVPVEPLSRSQKTPPLAQAAQTPQKAVASSQMLPPHRRVPLGHLLQQPQFPPQFANSAPMIPPQFANPTYPSPMIPQNPGPATPPPPPAVQHRPAPQTDSTPEKAAEQFRRMNSGLPDGVRYEPLDEETLRILKQKNPAAPAAPGLNPSAQNLSGQSLSATPTSPPPMQTPTFTAPAPMFQPPSPTPSLPAEAAEILRQLAQDERNASVFYAHFAQAEKEPFAVLATDSKARLALYVSLLAENFHENFSPQETEINTAIELHVAVALAISEENKGLVALGNLLDAAADTNAEKPLGRALNRKIIGHQLLLSLK